MKLLSVIALCVMFIVPSAACGAEQPSIKLGALYRLTGSYASIEGPACNGSKLAAELINKNGGLLGGRKLELIVVDTKADLQNAVSGADELVSANVTAGLGYCDTDPTLAVAPVFEQHRVPFLTVGATDPSLPKRAGRYMFMTPFGDDDQAYAMADFAYKTLGARKVVIWRNESTHYTRILAAFFKDRFLSLGGRLLEERSFKAGEEDFSAIIEGLKRLPSPPDAFFISGSPGDAAPTIHQLRHAGIRVPILSGDGFDADLLALLPKPEEAEGVYFATHAYFKSEMPEVVDFVRAYQEAYGKPPENSFAALGYDAVNLLANAIERAGNSEGKAVAEALAETRAFKAVTGEISFTRPSRVPIVPVGIVAIKNQTYRLMSTWTP